MLTLQLLLLLSLALLVLVEQPGRLPGAEVVWVTGPNTEDRMRASCTRNVLSSPDCGRDKGDARQAGEEASTSTGDRG